LSEGRRARAKAWAAGIDTARRRAGILFPDALSRLAGTLREQCRRWLAAEVSPGRDTLPSRNGWRPMATAGMPKMPRCGGVRCDDTGCVARLGDGRLVAMALGVEAFEEDCVRAAVVLSPRSAPGECSALLIDRNVWRSRGRSRSGRNLTVSRCRWRGPRVRSGRGP